MVSNELDGMQFDVVVLGTGLEESIIASEAAAGGKSVLHVDRNPYYGGSNACFSLSKMLEWAFCHRNCCQTPSVEVLVGGQLTDAPTFVISGEASDQHNMDTLQRLAPFELSPETTEKLQAMLKNDRSYMIELVPKVVFCRGELTEMLISCEIGEYVQFKGVAHSYLAHNGTIERIPESKEDIFASTSLSLIEKRKLMRLMTMVSDNTLYTHILDKYSDTQFTQLLQDKFKLSGMLLDAVLYLIVRVNRGDTISSREGCERLHKYVKSIGRYGRMAYLCGMYGGGSEISQSFCRLCAVSGGTYILNEKVAAIESTAENEFSVVLDHGTVRAKQIVMSPDYTSTAVPKDQIVSRAICILDNTCLGDDTTALASYVDDSGVVSLLYVTHSTMTVPSGQSILYAWVEGSLEETRSLLTSAIQTTIDSKASPLLSIFMESHELDVSETESQGIIVTRAPDATVDLDSAALSAQHVVSTFFPSSS